MQRDNISGVGRLRQRFRPAGAGRVRCPTPGRYGRSRYALAVTNPHDVPQAWQSRFDFFNAYGLQTSSLHAGEAYKALPFTARFRISSNFLAFLFGPLYFFAKGMWRKGLSLLGIIVVVGLVGTALDISDQFASATGTALAALAMITANYAYYLHVAKGSQSWNPFEGWKSRK